MFYFKHVLNLPYSDTAKTIKGKEKESLFKKQTSRNKIVKDKHEPKFVKKYGIYLDDGELSTKLDCIMIDENNKAAFPLQLKNTKTPKSVYKTQRLQLMLESFLIEKVLKYKSPYGYIRYALSNELIKLDLRDKGELFDIITRIKELIKSEILPPSTKYKKRIVDNCYRRFY
ncbi:Dna2/Cas4 domain-containing protein [Candidatus Pacearchaeota archaeon]|nr:Dna2/Cas4 domain-containing protein [Candidatus Pacearchaeota archaeon]